MKRILFVLLLLPLHAFAQVLPPPNPGDNPSNWVRGANSTPISSTTPVAIMTVAPTPTGTPAAASRIYIRDFTVANSSATVDTDVWLQNNGANVWPCPAASKEGGCAQNFSQPLRGSAGGTWSCKAVTTGASVTCAINGYVSPN